MTKSEAFSAKTYSKYRDRLRGAFDELYYRARYPDILLDIDAFEHYCELGWKEGRDPCPWFSNRLYLLANIDVIRKGIDPFLHYIATGMRNKVHQAIPPSDFTLPPETELIRDHFDDGFYRSAYRDIAGLDAFSHFCIHGWIERRDPARWFSTESYLRDHRDVAEAEVNPFLHYVFVGADQGRKAYPSRLSVPEPDAHRLKTKIRKAEIDLRKMICDAHGKIEIVLFLYIKTGSVEEMSEAVKTMRSIVKQVYHPTRIFIIRGRRGIDLSGLSKFNGWIGIEATQLSNVISSLKGSNLISFLYAGDELGIDALLELAEAADDSLELFYSDERRFDRNLNREVVCFKPNRASELLKSKDGLGSMWSVRARAIANGQINLILKGGKLQVSLGTDFRDSETRHISRVLCRSVGTSHNLQDRKRFDYEPLQLVYAGHPVLDMNIKRILIVKLDHIGDFVTAIPAIDRLKSAFPAAEITALVGRSSVPLATKTDSIDKVLEFNFFHERSQHGRISLSKDAFGHLEQELAPYDFDLAVDLRQEIETREVLRYTGASWCAGYDLRGRFPWLDICLESTPRDKLVHRSTHASDVLLQLVEAIVIASLPRGEMRSRRVQVNARKAVWSGRSQRGTSRIVLIQPGAGSDIKEWPAEHFGQLIDLLVDKEGATVAIIGSEDEKELAEKVMSLANSNKDRVISLIGTPLDDLPEILLSADLLVANNSGPQHLAASLGVPVIGLHSGIVDASEWGPLGATAVSIGRKMLCSPCYLEKIVDCQRHHTCMRDLLPADVYALSSRLLRVDPPESGDH